MSKELWHILDKIRGVEFQGPEGLAELLQNEGVHFSTQEVNTLGQFLATRLGRHNGVLHIPEWLAGVFAKLTEGLSTPIICDPWAGIGLLVAVVRESIQAKDVLAFTQMQSEAALGKVLVPDATWQVGDPLQLLGATTTELDVAASILPMGVKLPHPLTVATPTGGNIVLRDDLGNLILVAASMRLSAEGIGLFVVTPSFFFSQRSVLRQFDDLGLGIDAALALPSGTFAPYTNIPTYLVVVRKRAISRMFAAQLSSDTNTNRQIIANFKLGKEGGTLELGRFVDPLLFTGLDSIRATERFQQAERQFGASAVRLGELATVINLGRVGDGFEFPKQENSIFIPLIGTSDVVDSIDDLVLKRQNYAQVAIDPARSNAKFVARFLNSEFGREIREMNKSGAVIPKLNKQTLNNLRVFVPDLQTQKRMLELESRITSEQNTLLGLQNEFAEFRRELWADPRSMHNVDKRLNTLSSRLSGGLKQHAVESLEKWFDTLPFPLASILRAWQATQTQDFKTKHEHLLHFFEGAAEFLSVILLSAFSSNEALFEPHKQKLTEKLQELNLSFQRATFGTWKLVVEYLGKQTRQLLLESGKKTEDAKNDRAICADIFADPSLALPEALSRKGLAAILSATNKMRNDWSGHGGVVGQEEARLRNEQLLGELQKFREAMADTWADIQLIHALHCRPRRGVFENEVAILMGSNSDFLKEERSMSTWLDVERLYLSKKESGRALKLLPLIQVGPSPQSAKNACYFFNRLEQDGARFVSYHFTDKPELKGPFEEASEAIKFLTEKSQS
jgi:hypothetical protein